MCLGGILLFFMACCMLQAGWAEVQQLSVKKGETKVLLTKPNLNLQGDFSILWIFQPRGNSTFQNLASFGNGKSDHYTLESFKDKVILNKTTGALTLGPLDLGHSGFYHGQITEIDSSVHRFEFNITVEEFFPTLNALTAEPIKNTTKDHKDGRTHIAVVPAVIFAFFLGVILAIIQQIQKNKKGTSGTISSSSSSSSVELDRGKQETPTAVLIAQ